MTPPPAHPPSHHHHTYPPSGGPVRAPIRGEERGRKPSWKVGISGHAPVQNGVYIFQVSGIALAWGGVGRVRAKGEAFIMCVLIRCATRGTMVFD